MVKGRTDGGQTGGERLHHDGAVLQSEIDGVAADRWQVHGWDTQASVHVDEQSMVTETADRQQLLAADVHLEDLEGA